MVQAENSSENMVNSPAIELSTSASILSSTIVINEKNRVVKFTNSAHIPEKKYSDENKLPAASTSKAGSNASSKSQPNLLSTREVSNFDTNCGDRSHLSQDNIFAVGTMDESHTNNQEEEQSNVEVPVQSSDTLNAATSSINTLDNHHHHPIQNNPINNIINVINVQNSSAVANPNNMRFGNNTSQYERLLTMTSEDIARMLENNSVNHDFFPIVSKDCANCHVAFNMLFRRKNFCPLCSRYYCKKCTYFNVRLPEFHSSLVLNLCSVCIVSLNTAGFVIEYVHIPTNAASSASYESSSHPSVASPTSTTNTTSNNTTSNNNNSSSNVEVSPNSNNERAGFLSLNTLFPFMRFRTFAPVPHNSVTTNSNSSNSNNHRHMPNLSEQHISPNYAYNNIEQDQNLVDSSLSNGGCDHIEINLVEDPDRINVAPPRYRRIAQRQTDEPNAVAVQRSDVHHDETPPLYLPSERINELRTEFNRRPKEKMVVARYITPGSFLPPILLLTEEGIKSKNIYSKEMFYNYLNEKKRLSLLLNKNLVMQLNFTTFKKHTIIVFTTDGMTSSSQDEMCICFDLDSSIARDYASGTSNEDTTTTTPVFKEEETSDRSNPFNSEINEMVYDLTRALSDQFCTIFDSGKTGTQTMKEMSIMQIHENSILTNNDFKYFLFYKLVPGTSFERFLPKKTNYYYLMMTLIKAQEIEMAKVCPLKYLFNLAKDDFCSTITIVDENMVSKSDPHNCGGYQCDKHVPLPVTVNLARQTTPDNCRVNTLFQELVKNMQILTENKSKMEKASFVSDSGIVIDCSKTSVTVRLDINRQKNIQPKLFESLKHFSVIGISGNLSFRANHYFQDNTLYMLMNKNDDEQMLGMEAALNPANMNIMLPFMLIVKCRDLEKTKDGPILRVYKDGLVFFINNETEKHLMNYLEKQETVSIVSMKLAARGDDCADEDATFGGCDKLPLQLKRLKTVYFKWTSYDVGTLSCYQQSPVDHTPYNRHPSLRVWQVHDFSNMISPVRITWKEATVILRDRFSSTVNFTKTLINDLGKTLTNISKSLINQLDQANIPLLLYDMGYSTVAIRLTTVGKNRGTIVFYSDGKKISDDILPTVKEGRAVNEMKSNLYPRLAELDNSVVDMIFEICSVV